MVEEWTDEMRLGYLMSRLSAIACILKHRGNTHDAIRAIEEQMHLIRDEMDIEIAGNEE